jgi:glycosyltransferase involved in cell wall biosynthesis
MISDSIGGIPVKVIEFMACGCSVVSIWFPELAELIESDMEEGVRLLQTTDPENYAKVVDKMLNETAVLERISRVLMEHVQRNIVWEKEGARLVDFYRIALQKRGYFERICKQGR